MAKITHLPKHIAIFGFALATTFSAILPGHARDSIYKGDRGDYVVAESRFGNGTVVGPVRRTSVGRQVRTPGGSWLHCTRSCAETLRVNTVDFWENQGSHRGNNIDNEDGLLAPYFRWQRRY